MDCCLFPPCEPYAVHALAVGEGHVLHVEECGTPDGLPVIFLHGGPGSGCNPLQRRLFDPARWRIVLVDQRGAGRSLPTGCIEHNSTADLLGDLERIRFALGIDRWVVAGGSWGATLGLLYAEAFPDSTLGLLLRGTFLARPRDIAWYYRADGVALRFPSAWRAFVGHLDETERRDLLTSYYRRLTSSDPEVVARAAAAWAGWDNAVATWTLPPDREPQLPPDPLRRIAQARIAAHYLHHACFIVPNRVLANAHRLDGIPGILLHGELDRVCPIVQAEALGAVWPDADLVRLPKAGHLLAEPPMLAAWVEAAARLYEVVAPAADRGRPASLFTCFADVGEQVSIDAG